MTNSKIEIKIGIIEFSGEGDQEWLAEQLDKIIEKAPEFINSGVALAQPTPELKNETLKDNQVKAASSNVQKKPLASFIKDKSPKTQPQLFLVTSIWIHDNLGSKRIQQQDINTQLKESNQKPIGKPSQELGRNVKAGFIVKDGSQFYVTPDGRKQF